MRASDLLEIENTLTLFHMIFVNTTRREKHTEKETEVTTANQ